MKQLFVGSHPHLTGMNGVDFATLDGRDRVCELRVIIAAAYTVLRDEVPANLKEEGQLFHGPWLVWRNLMNEHPAACLDEYRHMATYFDCYTEDMITDIVNLIEQHIELTRQSTRLHPHQEKIMDQIAEMPTATVTHERNPGKGARSAHQHLVLAEKVRAYLKIIEAESNMFRFCLMFTRGIGSSAYEDFEDSTVEEMHTAVFEAVINSHDSLEEIRNVLWSVSTGLSLPAFGPATAKQDDGESADDENYALRG